jgi:flagellin
LAVQASNGSLNTSDRNALNQEFTAIIQEIDGIATNTQVFGLYPFGSNQVSASPSLDIFPDPLPADGSGRTFSSGIIPFSVIPINSTNLSFQLNDHGADDDIQLFTKNGKHLVGTNLSDSTWSSRGITDATTAGTVLLSQSGFNSGASYDGSNLLDGLNNNPGTTLTGSYNGMNFSFAGDYNWAGNLNESLTIDKVTEDLLLFVVGNGSFTASGSVTPPVTVGPIKIVLDSGFGDTPECLSIDRKPSDITSLGLYGTSVNSQSSSLEAITKLDAAIKMVGEYRTYFGANEARLEIAHHQNKSFQIASEAAVGKIVDADYAVEMSNLTRGRILQSSGESALLKANASTENVLDLLKPYRS